MNDSDFNESIIALRPHLKRFARCLTNNECDIEDLVQDTYLKALKHKEQFSSNDNLKAWLMTILKNQFINKYRRAKRAGEPIELDPNLKIKCPKDVSPDSVLHYKELYEIVDNISESNRLPFKLHVEGFKYEEIAEKMKVPIGTIKSRIFMARKEAMGIIYGTIKPKTSKNMDEVIIQFRTLCTILREKYGYTSNKIIISAGLNWPTFKKVTETPEDKKMVLESLTIDKLKRFVEKHSDKFSAHDLPITKAFGVRHETKPVPHPEAEKTKKHRRTKKEMQEAGLKPEPGARPEPEKKPDSFWDLIQRAGVVKPANVTLQVLIK